MKNFRSIIQANLFLLPHLLCSIDSTTIENKATQVIVSPSKESGEWQFIFKNIYEQACLQDKPKLDNITSTQGTQIGPKSTVILSDSIQSKKSYLEYLQILLNAVTPADINLSTELISAPEEISIPNNSFPSAGKSIKDIYNLISTQVTEEYRPYAIKNLNRALQPEVLKLDLAHLIAEDDYCSQQKIKIKETISIFSPQEIERVEQPQSFGDLWLVKKTEYKGTDTTIIINPSTPDNRWNSCIELLQQCLQPIRTLTNIKTSQYIYEVAPVSIDYAPKNIDDATTEIAALKVQAIKKRALTIIDSMKFKMNGSKKILIGLYPSPLAAFNQAWNNIYSATTNKATIKNSKGTDTQVELKDPENVQLLHDELLRLYAGLDFGSIKINLLDQAVAEDEDLPESLQRDLKQYFDSSNKKISEINMISAMNNVTFPEGWRSAGPQGIQTPSGEIISMKEVMIYVKTYSPSLDSNQPKIDTVAPKIATVTPKTTIIEASSPQSPISSDLYNLFLGQVQKEIQRIKTKDLKAGRTEKSEAQLLNVITTMIKTDQSFKDLHLSDEIADDLIVSLVQNKTYDDFIKKYTPENLAPETSVMSPEDTSIIMQGLHSYSNKTLSLQTQAKATNNTAQATLIGVNYATINQAIDFQKTADTDPSAALNAMKKVLSIDNIENKEVLLIQMIKDYIANFGICFQQPKSSWYSSLLSKKYLIRDAKNIHNKISLDSQFKAILEQIVIMYGEYDTDQGNSHESRQYYKNYSDKNIPQVAIELKNVQNNQTIETINLGLRDIVNYIQ